MSTVRDGAELPSECVCGPNFFWPVLDLRSRNVTLPEMAVRALLPTKVRQIQIVESFPDNQSATQFCLPCLQVPGTKCQGPGVELTTLPLLGRPRWLTNPACLSVPGDRGLAFF